MAYDDSGADPPSAPATGLLASLRRLLSTAAEIVHTRIELLSTELEEEGVRVRELLLYELVSLFFLAMGLLLVTLFVVLAFWETHRLSVLAGFAVFYLAIGAATAIIARNKLKARPRLFSATLSELSKDRDHLNGKQ